MIMNPLPSKPWWRSKTLWVNLAMGALALFAGTPIPGLSPATGALVAAGANMVLRVITSKPLSMTSDPTIGH